MKNLIKIPASVLPSNENEVLYFEFESIENCRLYSLVGDKLIDELNNYDLRSYILEIQNWAPVANKRLTKLVCGE